ncbi:hypothetical protein [Endozoicomonas sp. SCSIO W0465]|uniref:hypothetical protein n=1 Tax=Endozoicomonas sp. SCSIO W0465 TaxID=2918516 RepID=UPI0020761353|nr:hypothetical protein [Endozoicomonas sp. SCSIO W0465]USE35572.1 hypothetical protein MJO57_26355 [Endozoicomonas sp. SCSIO W0465]
MQATDEWSDDGWDDDSWGGEWQEAPPSPWVFRGFAEAGYGRRTGDDPATNQSSTLSEIRGRLSLDYVADNWRLDMQTETLFDDVANDTEWTIREMALSFSPLDQLDIKAGRQVVTWGIGDYLFLNDLFPKDWQSFFSGRDDEYLKAPSDSLKASLFAEYFSFDLVWTPEFEPDNSLTGERFSFFSPGAGTTVAPDPILNPDEPTGSTLSTRLATNHKGVEYALYGYSGYWPTPQGISNQGQMFYPGLNGWGGSVRMPVSSGLFNAEFSWYDSEDDRDGTDPNIPNSQLRGLLGYEREMANNLTAAVQYYLEWTADYDSQQLNAASPEYSQDEYRQLLTLRLTWLTMQQKLNWSLFSFWSPSDEDAYIRPSVTYRVNDQWTVATGANLFCGNREYSFFGQHENNSNAWVRALSLDHK